MPTPTADATFTMDEQASLELLRACRTLEAPPYLIQREDGKPDTRLKRALEVIQQGKVLPQSDGTYIVKGSTQDYTCGSECSCKQGQYGKSKFCYHLTAVKLYQEWQHRLGKGPVTPQPKTPPEAPTIDEEPPMLTTDPQETLIVEPAPSQEAKMPSADPAVSVQTLPALPAVTSELERSITEWTHQRQLLTRYIKEHMRLGVDFYTLTMRGQETKPALSKAGAEKFLNLFHLHASFRKDEDTWEMLGRPVGLLCYVCTLTTSGGEVVGEGRGARDIKKDGGDVNKAIKMGQKSAMGDAVLRTGALSDLFTQDAADEEDAPEPAQPVVRVDYRREIMRLLDTVGTPMGDRAHYMAVVQEMTGLALEPENYALIVERLKAKAQERNGALA